MLRSIYQATQHGYTASQLLRVISPCSTVMCDGQSYLPRPWGSIEQRRNTVVVERVVRAPTTKPGHTVKLKNKHKLLRLVETEHTRPTPDIQCILTGYVEGYGDKGDVLWVRRRVFRNQLYPLGLALYASPENLAENERMKKEMGDQGKVTRLSPFARMTSRKLSGMFLPIPMSGDNPWTLSKSHVKVAFRRMYVELTEDCIELPEDEITEPGHVEVKVTINKTETVAVKGCIYLVYKDPSKNIVPEMPPLWEPFEKKSLAQKLAES